MSDRKPTIKCELSTARLLQFFTPKYRLKFEAFARPELFTARHTRASENLRIALTQGAESREATQQESTQRHTQHEHDMQGLLETQWHIDNLFVDSLRCVLVGSLLHLDKLSRKIRATGTSTIWSPIRCKMRDQFYTSKDSFKSFRQWHIDELFVFFNSEKRLTSTSSFKNCHHLDKYSHN